MKRFLDLELSELVSLTVKQVVDYRINVVDTAIVHRHMKSERDIGRVLSIIPREK